MNRSEHQPLPGRSSLYSLSYLDWIRGELCGNRRRSRRRVTRFVGIAVACLLLAIGETPRMGAEDFHPYRVQYKDVREVEKLILDLVAGEKDVHVVADERGKRILVSGPEPAQRIVRELIESVDKPSRPRDETPVVRTYDCPKDSLTTLSQRLRTRFAGDERVRVSVECAGVATDPAGPAEHSRRVRSRIPKAFSEASRTNRVAHSGRSRTRRNCGPGTRS